MESRTDFAISLRRIISKLGRQMNSSAAGEGLTPSQASVLALIAKRGPLGLAELTNLEGLNPTMVSRIVGKLDDARLIRRIPDERDLRAATVEITADGRQVNQQIMQRRARVVADSLAALSAEDFDALRAAAPVLERLAEGLSRQQRR